MVALWSTNSRGINLARHRVARFINGSVDHTGKYGTINKKENLSANATIWCQYTGWNCLLLGGHQPNIEEPLQLTATCSMTQIPEWLSPWVSLGNEEHRNYQPKTACMENRSPEWRRLARFHFFFFSSCTPHKHHVEEHFSVFVLFIPHPSLHPSYLASQ